MAAHRFDKAARLLLGAAAEGSVSARSTLEKADANLRRAMTRLRGSKQLSREQRSVLAEILKSQAHASAARPSAWKVAEAGMIMETRAFSRWESMARGHRGF